ncbi:potassium channel subfamily K member 5-like [Carassius auratus]|uniref:Potassium channel subfamily K member 5-like n=1 Tax=Carassius auratus TaxID=7957 RepID=A0A6P6KG61_CARAU|nr:potassium channel subfamily K member 5-like [Carassius auratus]XP_052475741.1 potassium channel subfamily K member 5 [Carassius gibelio]
MVDKGPLLTSAIIFYLSIGAAIFQVIEEPNWETAVNNYKEEKEKILKQFPCLTKVDLDRILKVVSDAAGQGITITGDKTFNNWNWPNAVIFAATVITTIGYGNIAPKTPSGRVFCIFYGLFGVPLCFTWISELGKFFGGRAKHLGQYLTKKGVTLRRTQFTCTAVFLLWGVLVHLVIPPFVFMSQEGWTYIEGLYFSFVTLTTIGFGDLVAGVDPSADYPTLYRYFVEVWIYLGLAWLSLFFNWKVRMVVEAHKALKKRRKRRKLSLDELQRIKENHKTLHLPPTPNDANIFSFLSKRKECYNDLIKQIGTEKEGEAQHVSFITGSKNKTINRSKSCSDSLCINGNSILSLDRSPRQKRHYSFSDRVTVALSKSKSYLPRAYQEERCLMNERHGEGEKDTDLDCIRLYENQLDKEAGEDHKGLEPRGCNDGRITWDSKSYQTLMFPNPNITFIDEENLLINNLEDNDNDFIAKFSTAYETDFKKGQFTESETSVFTTEGSDHDQQLVEEYSKEDNTDI